MPVLAEAPQDVWVDDGYCAACANDGHTWSADAFATIAAGLRSVATGGVVHVAPGYYEEDVTITRPLRLLATEPGAVVAPRLAAATVTVAANDVTVEGLEVEGGWQAGILVLGPNFQREAIRGVSIRRNTVRGGLFGIAANVNVGATWDYGTLTASGVEIAENTVSGCTRALYVYNARADITSNSVTDLAAEGIGIYSSQGSVSSIRQNKVRVDSPNSRGIYVLDNKGTVIDGNSLVGSSDVLTPTTAITLYGFDDLVLRNNAIRGFYWGTNAYTGGTARVERNTFQGTAAWAMSFGTAITTTQVTITDNVVRGSYWGLRLDDDGGNGLQALVQGNAFGDNVVGVQVAASTGSGQVRLHGNAFCGNLTAGLRSESEAMINATDNWWGANDGPQPDGSGDRIDALGRVEARPWMRLRASAQRQGDGFATIRATLAGERYRLGGFGLILTSNGGSFVESSSGRVTVLTDAYGQATAQLALPEDERASVTISSACGPILTVAVSEAVPEVPLPIRLPPLLR